MNKVVISGNLCREHDIKISQSGKDKILRNTIASKRNFKNKNGQYESDFINFVVIGKGADFLDAYSSKGDKVLLEGSWRTGSYVNGSGNTIYTNELMVEHAELLSKPQRVEIQQEPVKEEKQDDNPFAFNSDDLPF